MWWTFYWTYWKFYLPSYPSNYCINQDCYYNITVIDGSGIIFKFTTFNLDDPNGMNPDSVKVYPFLMHISNSDLIIY